MTTVEADATLGLRRGARLPSGWPATLTAVLGYGSLAGLLAVSTLLVTAAASAPGFLVPANRSRLPDWIAGVFAHSGVSLTGAGFVLVLGLLFVGYAVALACRHSLSPRVILLAIGLLVALYTVAPPILSGDVFSYIAYARLGVVHGGNPYVHGPIVIPHDPVIPFTHWLSTLSVYGPVFTLASYALVPLGLAGTLWGLKALAGISTLALLAFVWKTAERLERDPLTATMVVGLNPMILAYGVGGAHNDIMMLALAMAGVMAAVAGREARGAALLASSVAVKASTVIVAPFMVVGVRRPGRAVLGGLAGVAALAVLGLAVFGTHGLGFLLQLEKHQNLSSASSWPDTLAAFFGHIPSVRLLGRLVLIGTVIGLLVAVWRGTMDWIAASGWSLLLLAVTSPWLLAWYTFWPLPLAAVTRDRRLLAAVIFAQVLFVLHRVPALAG